MVRACVRSGGGSFASISENVPPLFAPHICYNPPMKLISLNTKSEKFADYVFVSPEVTVKDFMVLQDQVSDHLPLWVEFR